MPAAGHALWLTLALELLNLLDADDFAEAEAFAEATLEEKLRRLVLSRCRALPPEVRELYGVFLQQLEKTAGVVESRAWPTFSPALQQFPSQPNVTEFVEHWTRKTFGERPAELEDS